MQMMDRAFMRGNGSEFRRETRVSIQGEVLLYPQDLTGYIVGQLLDVSKNGFRVAHNYESMPPGREVGFKHRFSQGTARVAWTLRIGGHIECGCEVVRD